MCYTISTVRNFCPYKNNLNDNNCNNNIRSKTIITKSDH